MKELDRCLHVAPLVQCFGRRCRGNPVHRRVATSTELIPVGPAPAQRQDGTESIDIKFIKHCDRDSGVVWMDL